MEQADLYFAGDILRLLNSHPDEFAAMPHLRVSALVFSGNDNFGEITFNSTKGYWEFNSPIDESNYAIFDFGGPTFVSKDEKKYLKNMVRTLNQSISPPVESYAKLETPRTFSFEILDDKTAARIGSIFYHAKKSKYVFIAAANIVFTS
jgi:hypothetical protein